MCVLSTRIFENDHVMTKAHFLPLILCLASAVHADAFRCKAANGQTTISSVPCGDNSSTTRVVIDGGSSPDSIQRAQAELSRQKEWLKSREREQQVSTPKYAVASNARTVSGDAYDPATRDRIHACLMQITATTGLSPSQEASRKVGCYRGTVGLADECEGRITATSRLGSREEEMYKAQCRSL